MKITAVDQLVVVSDGDSYAAAMGAVYPVNGGNAQYYLADGDGKVTEVSPMFSSSEGEYLLFFPQLFSAAESRYLEATGMITFRFNSRTSDEAIIAQGTMAQYTNGTALRSGTWNTAAQGKTAQTYAQVFQATTYTFGGVSVPALKIIGQLAYRTKNDMSIFCTCEVGDNSLTCKGDVEIRSKTADNYKVVISATSSAGGNDQVINTSDEKITLTASLLHNGTAIAVGGGSATYKWYKFGEPSSVLGTTATLQVSESMVPGVAEFVCEVTYNGSTYSASITINDIQDQYMIDKGRVTKDSSNNTVENTGILKPSYKVTYTPSIVDKHTGGAPTGLPGTWSYTFILKNAAGQVVDSTGTVSAGASTTASTLTIQGTAVKKAGGMSVMINAVNSSI